MKKRQNRTRRAIKKRKAAQKRKTADIIISRSTGRKEKFDTDRMAQNVSRSGVPFLMARDIAKTISRKIVKEQPRQRKKEKLRKTVSAARVRKLVSNELRDRNRSDIAASYSGEVPETQDEKTQLKISEEKSIDTARQDSVMHDRSKRMSSAP